ncbi:MAG TPA: energy coupling factor transporter S component ThiW [Ruminiclostridium sp.]|nr:energy coupling factor transporter S component ThiW [Ruminiclostridium sp.]
MKTNVKKLALSGLLVAVAVIGSTFSFPVGVAKCAPVQHMVNVLGGILLGPWYAVGVAFATSCIRILAGTGTFLAFPGSMCGALLCGLLYKKFGNMVSAFLGEVVGTGIIGAILAYPVATLFLSKKAAIFGFVIPFSVSSVGGAAISILLVYALKRTRAIYI